MIRKATIKDIKAVHSLLQKYGEKGELLSRPLSELYDHVRDFMLYIEEGDGKILGCCALQFCWEDLAEIRSLAVHPDHVRKKIGTRLTEAALAEAKTFHIKQVFALTYKPAFFEKFGFVKIDRSKLPLKIWGDCIICVKFPDCDETAMMKEMDY
jgi:amino-acid N-acetyltransferase